MELLAIVEAERQADALVAAAFARREEQIALAYKKRSELLASLTPPPLLPVSVRAAKPHLEQLKDAAARNKQKAVKAIMEELHAT